MAGYTGRWIGRASDFGLLLEDRAALVHAGLQVDVVRPAQLAAVLVLDIGRRLQRIGGTAHTAPGRVGFSLRHGHDGDLLTTAAAVEGAAHANGPESGAYRGRPRPTLGAARSAVPRPGTHESARGMAAARAWMRAAMWRVD